ncbi:hypothetical protein PtA15_2A284 [Puccinia triticina]|uniref:Uncharacterized protein n=1 Tax=Puccinia triticina TaxID=208348 RepID=A0ABY7CCU5_9BASI|nr:uncharacterized protein PtA15_2A284 [Puccinia triticina]WAQ81971.1 hypothetical protein PtA15_2A284 [Puccinia triticina]
MCRPAANHHHHCQELCRPQPLPLAPPLTRCHPHRSPQQSNRYFRAVATPPLASTH